MVSPSQAPSQASTPSAPSPQGAVAGSVPSPLGPQTQQSGLNIVVLDPAHGGTDSGARGTGGICESGIVLDFAVQVRHALGGQGFQVVQTGQGNGGPSFFGCSATAHAQGGAGL